RLYQNLSGQEDRSMRRIRTYAVLVTTCLLGTLHVYGQGKPSVLRCAFKGTVELHASAERSSPIIEMIACGSSITVLEEPAASRPRWQQIGAGEGKEVYSVTGNVGQWWIDPEGRERPSQATTTGTPPQPVPLPPATKSLSETPKPSTLLTPREQELRAIDE